MNFKTLKHPIVYGSIVIFVIYHILELTLEKPIPYLHAYLDDLVCMPIVLGLTTQIAQWIHPVKEYYYLSPTHILLAVIFYSLLFEWILPVVNPQKYTADIFDILFYLMGATIFYFLVSKPNQKRYLTFLSTLE